MHSRFLSCLVAGVALFARTLGGGLEVARFDADATPSTGSDTLREHYAQLLRGEVQDDRGAHAVF
jgi:hypothetical protein